MKHLKSTLQDLREFFDQSINAKYIAETFKVFDSNTPAIQANAFMNEMEFDVVGISEDGVMTGYVEKTSLQDGICGDYLIPFSPTCLVSETTPLITIIEKIQNSSRLFVLSRNQIDGIITRGDLQKAPARMWLFGLVSLTEMQFLRLIRNNYPNESWKDELTKSRIEKAEEILSLRRQRNENIDLADCLELCDKGELLVKNEITRKQIGFESKASAKKLLKKMEDLRNNLAHAQDIISGNWPEICEVAKSIEILLDKCENIKDDAA